MKIKLLDKRLTKEYDRLSGLLGGEIEVINIEYPKYATSGSAAIDLRACSFERQKLNLFDTYYDKSKKKFYLCPGERVLIGTGIALDLLINTRYGSYPLAGLVLPRSGLGSKGITLSNSVGLIDTDYQGEIKISLWNTSEDVFIINDLDRIAQLMFISYFKPTFEVVEEFEPSDRGESGFGSTGSE
jgi:dUTP pyrophosphatase